jgi:hypothetical protein
MQSKNSPEAGKHKIKKDIAPLVGGPQARGVSMLNQLNEPRIVKMASKIPRLDPPLPKARNEYD